MADDSQRKVDGDLSASEQNPERDAERYAYLLETWKDNNGNSAVHMVDSVHAIVDFAKRYEFEFLGIGGEDLEIARAMLMILGSLAYVGSDQPLSDAEKLMLPLAELEKLVEHRKNVFIENAEPGTQIEAVYYYGKAATLIEQQALSMLRSAVSLYYTINEFGTPILRLSSLGQQVVEVIESTRNLSELDVIHSNLLSMRSRLNTARRMSVDDHGIAIREMNAVLSEWGKALDAFLIRRVSIL